MLSAVGRLVLVQARYPRPAEDHPHIQPIAPLDRRVLGDREPDCRRVTPPGPPQVSTPRPTFCPCSAYLVEAVGDARPHPRAGSALPGSPTTVHADVIVPAESGFPTVPPPRGRRRTTAPAHRAPTVTRSAPSPVRRSAARHPTPLPWWRCCEVGSAFPGDIRDGQRGRRPPLHDQRLDEPCPSSTR